MSISQEKKTSAKQDQVDPEEVFRIYSIVFYIIVLIIIGLPTWWYTTRVYRANLPLGRMQEVDLKKHIEKEFGTPLSLEYDILMSFVHPDPLNPRVELSGEHIEENLQPFLNNISSIAEFIVKSQWLYLLDLGATPKKNADHYALMENQLPHIITPLEAKLWSHLSPRPTINLLIFFQRCNDLPIYIYDNNNQRVKSNAFLSPRWGGIYIINPDKESCANGILKPDLHNIVSIFITQIQKLFKIDNILDSDNIYELKMRKSTEMVDSTYRTLASLAELLSEIKSIVISEDVGEKINFAVENVDSAKKCLIEGDVDKGLEYAKIAFKYSEEAFSDPSLLSLLYFPEDQKYAVYIPLFLPIMIPVLMSVSTLKKWTEKRMQMKRTSQ